MELCTGNVLSLKDTLCNKKSQYQNIKEKKVRFPGMEREGSFFNEAISPDSALRNKETV